MKFSPEQLLFDPLFNAATESRILIGVAIVTIGLIGFARAATDCCQNTAQDASMDARMLRKARNQLRWANALTFPIPPREPIVESRSRQIFTTLSKPVRTGMRRARLPARNLVRLDMIR